LDESLVDDSDSFLVVLLFGNNCCGAVLQILKIIMFNEFKNDCKRCKFVM
jgi:hypothetical protein